MTQTSDVVISPQWVYDEIMRHIEPDLLTSQIPLLEQKYAGETEEERKNRFAHYAWAYDIFDECLEDIDDEMQLDVAKLKRWLTNEARVHSSESEHEEMENIEQSFDKTQA